MIGRYACKMITRYHDDGSNHYCTQVEETDKSEGEKLTITLS